MRLPASDNPICGVTTLVACYFTKDDRMSFEQDLSPESAGGMKRADFDVVVVGAGITGIHQLYRMREAGFSVLVLEAGSGVGGTWYWNRYPGARTDSEAYSYGYFFSEALWQEWNWRDHFPSQPEMEAYLNHVVDKFDLRRDIRLNARVEAATFDDSANLWDLNATDGIRVRTRFVITAMGLLSAPFTPEIPGRGSFSGEQYHTGEWPLHTVNFTGKRVAVIGTGASGVQIVPAIADDVASLTVYQRTPNWIAPLNNDRVTVAEMEEIKAGYDAIYDRVRSTFSGFLHADNGRSTFDDSPEIRWETYETIWNDKGHSGLFGNYSDMATSKQANEQFCKYLEQKVRSIVKDPAIATKLIPTDHLFGGKRPPLDSYGYFEAFNRDNILLVDLRETPITRISETGIQTDDGELEFDIIVWATGFDAVTGALTRVNIHGVGGQTLQKSWADGPQTYLGVQSPGFPNLLFTAGAHGTYGNIPRCTEIQVEFITDLLKYAREKSFQRVEPDQLAVGEWTEHVYDIAKDLLAADSAWFYGANIPGKARRFLFYIGGLPAYRQKLAAVAENHYQGFIFADAVTSAPRAPFTPLTQSNGGLAV
jgi:cation diffusion facilitator CzcD-associated flavoprotein CzcO